MKGTKTIIWTFILLVIMAGVIAFSAIYFPLPIAGKLNGENVGNQLVEITNLRSGEIMGTHTTNAGEFLVDWANSDDRDGTIRKYSVGDKFKVNVIGCNEDYCTKEISYEGEPELFTSFNLWDTTLPKIITTTTTTKCNTCDVCDVYEECEECPVDWKGIGAGVVITLIISMVGFMGGGLKIYKSRLGTTKFLHRHRGISAYHDPNTQHRDKRYKHRSWTKDPMGCVQDVKKIEEGGLI